MREPEDTGKIVFIPETLVDMARNHGVDNTREAFHSFLDAWMDRYLEDEE